MKTLMIMRHAKSSWDDASLSDFDRPLNKRGKEAAPFMGKFLAGKGLTVDLILSSPAKRAKETAELVKQAANWSTPVEFNDHIYEASPQTLYSILSKVNDELVSLMIVGHNPGMEGFVKLLTGKLVAMSTASVALVEFDVDVWSRIEPGAGQLIDVFRPKELETKSHKSEQN
jgi:phosphohistidine phosphatase